MAVWKLSGFTHDYEHEVIFKEWLLGIQSRLQADEQAYFLFFSDHYGSIETKHDKVKRRCLL
ncbi:unnamed protein product, partial [Ilex paraguariensis]